MAWLGRIFGILILIVVVVVVSLMLLPGERIARIAADQISALTGREVQMSGDTRISLYPVLGISTGKVEIANAGWSQGGPMLQADSFKLGVEPRALIGGDIRITGLEAVNPRILLERAADGRVNWELGVEGVAPSGLTEDAQPARSSRLALTLDRALITNAELIYADHATGDRLVLAGTDLDLRWPDYQGAATFDAVLRPAGDAVEVAGRLDKVGSFIAGGVSDIDVTATAPGGKVRFNGRAGMQPQVGGRVSADLGNTARFLGALGVGGAEIPSGLGRALGLEGQITLTEDMRLSLREGVLRLDEYRLDGAADILLGGAKPRVNAQLRAGALDLSGLAGGEGDGGGGGGAEGWSREAIDASALALFDGEVALVAESVKLGGLSLGKTRTLMTLDRSRAVFALRELRAYDGVLTGEFVANNRSGLSVGGKLFAGGVELKPLLTDVAGLTRLSGAADAEISFLGVGQSVDAIMNSLTGEGALKVGQGVISGIDLNQLMRAGTGTGGTTVFDSLGATFQIAEGNLRNDDLLMTLPQARAVGEGRIGLGKRDINYLFTPTALEARGGKGLAIPVRIRGPWSKPQIIPDLEQAIDLNLAGEKKRLEREVREKVTKEIEDKLGVQAEEGQSIEDAIEKKLKDEAAKGLLKLLE